MKKVVVLLICIVLFLVMSGCSQPQSAQGQPATPMPTPTKTIARPTTSQPITVWTLQPQTPTPSVSDNTISIASMAFNPPSLTVKKGSIVRWVNTDAVAHTVGVRGSFNAMEAAGLGAGGPADRIAAATEKTAAMTEKIAVLAKDWGVNFN